MSRFITYPSTVKRAQDHTVVLIDATVADIENVGMFCKSADKDYDIYLYRSDLDDLQYLGYVVSQSDRVLINETSDVYVQNSKQVAKFGDHQDIASALDYFMVYDTIKENVNE